MNEKQTDINFILAKENKSRKSPALNILRPPWLLGSPVV
jgi:hypothetical protein